MNHIRIDLEHILGDIDRNVFGTFAEPVLQVVYGGIYDPSSPLADKDGLRSDVRAAIERLNFSNIRFPGGNFVSGYRWMDGIGPQKNARAGMNWLGTVLSLINLELMSLSSFAEN